MLKDVLKSKPNVDVVKLQKSGGVVSRNPKVRQKARGLRIRVMTTLLEIKAKLASALTELMDILLERLANILIYLYLPFLE